MQSAPTVAKLFPSGQNEMSKTSLSWVIINFDKVWLSMSQREHVVSIEEQQIILGSVGFQSKEVRGDASSVYYLFIREHKCWYSLSPTQKIWRQSEVEANKVWDLVPGWCRPNIVFVGEYLWGIWYYGTMADFS